MVNIELSFLFIVEEKRVHLPEVTQVVNYGIKIRTLA